MKPQIEVTPEDIERVNEFLRERVRIGKSTPAKVSEIAEKLELDGEYTTECLWQSTEVVRTTDYSRRGNTRYVHATAGWTRIRRSRKEILTLLKRYDPEDMRFTRVLVKTLKQIRPDLKNVHDFDRLMEHVTDEEVKRAYRWAGPFTEKAAQLSVKPADTPKKTSRDGAESDREKRMAVWPFKISRKRARMMLSRMTSRSASYFDEVDWVSNNINNRLASPQTAPTNRAWSMLVWVHSKSEKMTKFFGETVRHVALRKEQEREAKRLMDDDRRTQFRLIAKVEAERAQFRQGGA